MCFWYVLLTLELGLGPVFVADVQKTAAAASNARVDELVRQLGSPNFPVREKAHKELEALGLPALEGLRRAIMSADLETSRRASDLVRKLEDKVATANLLAPKRVHLQVKNMPALEAVAELSRQSGYAIQVGGDRTVLAQRQVTLDTGKTTFWEAFDKLCAAAGLVEESAQAKGNQPVIIQPVPGRPIRIRAVPAPALPLVPPAPPKQGGAERGQVFLAAAVALQAQDESATDRRKALPMHPGQILVRAGRPPKVSTYYHGALRVRLQTSSAPPGVAVPAGADKDRAREVTDALWLLFSVAAEPRLQGVTIVGNPRIDKALDEHGQNLSAIMGDLHLPLAMAQGLPRLQAVFPQPLTNQGQNNYVRLKKGPKASKILKEVSGSLAVQALTPPEPLLTVDKILQAAGKTVEGTDGSSIQVQGVDKQANGIYRLQLHMKMPPAANAGNPFVGAIQMPGGQIQQIQIQVNGGGFGFAAPSQSAGMPDLVDAKGKKFQLVGMPARNLQINNGAVSQTVTLLFRQQNGQGEPDRLVLNGQRTVTVQVPFIFRDVPLS